MLPVRIPIKPLRNGICRGTIETATSKPKDPQSSRRNMKAPVIAVVLFALLSVGHCQTVQICQGVADNVFLANINNCSQYYICQSQQAVLQYCDNNLYFNAAQQSCSASTAGCVTCNPNELQLLPYERTCNQYIMCFAGEPLLRQCADDLQFNANTSRCDLQTNVDCVINNCNIFNNAQNIVYIESANSCEKYYVCMNGNAIALNCSKGLQFNPLTNQCEVSGVSCTKTAAGKASPYSYNPRAASYHAMDTPAEYVDINCPPTGIHFSPHARPDQYFMCVNGKGAMLTCSQGLFYDVEAKACRTKQRLGTH